MQVRLLFLLVGLSLLMRCGTFWPWVIDHDESTYLIIADQLLQGAIPYVDNLDVKPIGIYLLFAICLSVTHSIWIVRVMAALVVAGTAFYLGKAHDQYFGSNRKTVVAILYIFCASLHKWSWTANTEIFFLLFTSLSLYLLTKSRSRYDFLIGLLWGAGLLFKIHILFDALALGLYFVVWKNRGAEALRRTVVMMVGFILPTALVAFVYETLGFSKELWFALYTIPSRYITEVNLVDLVRFLLEFYFSFLPFSILFFWGLFKVWKNQTTRSHAILLTLWLGLGWLAVTITGKNYFHYYLQLLPCFCFFLPSFYPYWSGDLRNFLNRNKWASPLLFALFLLPGINQWVQLRGKNDRLKDIYEIIQQDFDKKDVIYTNDQSVLYFLLETNPPTKFIHTSLLYKQDLVAAYGINPHHELSQIMSQNPKYLILRKDTDLPIDEILKLEYQLLPLDNEEVKVLKIL